MTTQKVQGRMGEPCAAVQNIIDHVGKVLVGKSDVVRLCIVAMISGGHVLVEDVPGVGKTMLVRALAKSLDCQFKRIQFTPDLLPSDVTGTSIFHQGSGEFVFRPGPIFSQIVLADEINRTSPKTQSALLEALEEHSVSFDGVTHALPRPFFLLATQNPIEYEGTFPLPEAQLDRFLLKLSLGYPSREEELSVLARGTTGVVVESLQPIATPEDIAVWKDGAARVLIDPSLHGYIVDIVHQTRRHNLVYLGVSPRGGIALARAAQSLAYVSGRDYVIPDDIKHLVPHVFGHRLILHPEARIRGILIAELLAEILAAVPVPIVRMRR